MIITLVIMMIIFAGAGATSYLTLSSMQTNNFNQAIADNNEIGKEAKELLIRDIHRINNSSEFYAPVGDNTSTGYTTLPEFLGSKRFSSNGTALQYCPTSGSSTTSSSDKVLQSNGTDYSISTINNPAKAGYKYVDGSDLKLNNVLAFILSPLGSNKDIPSCNDISYKDGVYTATKGQVFAITEMDMISNEVNNSISQARVDPTSTNDLSLENGKELTSKSLTTNIKRFKSSNIQEMIIYLEAGVYDVPVGVMKSSSIEGKRLFLVGNGSATINTPSIDMEGVDITIKGVNTDSDFAINNSRVSLDNAEVGSIVSRGGELVAKDSTINGSIDAQGSDMRAMDSTVVGDTIFKGSTLRITDSFDFGQVQAISGSTVNIVDANGEIDNTNFGIGISGSIVSIDGSTVNIGGATAINNKGELVIWNSDIRSKGSAYGILSSNGGVNRISGSDVFKKGGPTLNAFYDDNGTALVAGSSSSFGGECKGDVFNDLTTKITTVSGEQTVSIPNPNNQASWSCI